MTFHWRENNDGQYLCEKIFNLISSRNCKLNPQWDATSTCMAKVFTKMCSNGSFMHYWWGVVLVQLLSRVWLFATPSTAAHQASLSSTCPGACSNSCSSSWWCHPVISSSVIPFSSRLQSFPVSRSFQMSWFFVSGGQSIRTSASASVLPMNIQDWFPLG